MNGELSDDDDIMTMRITILHTGTEEEYQQVINHLMLPGVEIESEEQA